MTVVRGVPNPDLFKISPTQPDHKLLIRSFKLHVLLFLLRGRIIGSIIVITKARGGVGVMNSNHRCAGPLI